MVGDGKAKQFDIIVAEDVARLPRDIGDLANLHKTMTLHGVEVHTINDGVLTE
jgi:site-specific DNA recombinase